MTISCEVNAPPHPPVQGFFAFRIYAFSKKLHIAILVWVMAFFILLGFTVIFITAMRMSSILLYAMQWGWLATALWSVSAANDLVIAATLAILLRNRRTDAHRRYDFGIASELKITHIIYIAELRHSWTNSFCGV
jgi:hypothetical protein